MNIHFEVADAGATSGTWAASVEAAARSACGVLWKACWPAKDEAFGAARAAVSVCAAVRRERARDALARPSQPAFIQSVQRVLFKVSLGRPQKGAGK